MCSAPDYNNPVNVRLKNTHTQPSGETGGISILGIKSERFFFSFLIFIGYLLSQGYLGHEIVKQSQPVCTISLIAPVAPLP